MRALTAAGAPAVQNGAALHVSVIAKLTAFTFWTAGLSLTFAVLAAPLLLVALFLPFAGFWYLVFCVIAAGGDRR